MVVVFTGGGADTDQIAPFLFKAIKADSPLPKNDIGERRLLAVLASARLPVESRETSPSPDTARVISGKSIVLDPNPLGLESISLIFRTRTRAAAVLKFRDQSWSFPVGLDGQYQFANAGPYDLPLAAAGRWQSETEFILDVNTVANINHFLFHIRFDGKRARIIMNEVTGELKDVKIDARLGELPNSGE
jgi:hypothetical protein